MCGIRCVHFRKRACFRDRVILRDLFPRASNRGRKAAWRKHRTVSVMEWAERFPGVPLEHFGFFHRPPCPILSAFFCGMGGKPITIPVYAISKKCSRSLSSTRFRARIWGDLLKHAECSTIQELFAIGLKSLLKTKLMPPVEVLDAASNL